MGTVEVRGILRNDTGPSSQVNLGTTWPGRDNIANIRGLKVASGVLTPGATLTYAFAWQNPEPNEIIVREVIILIWTAATAAATLDVGITASAITNDDIIFDGIALNAIAQWSSHEVGSLASESPQIVSANGGATPWVTGYNGSIQSMAGLVAKYYIFYQSI